MIALRIIAAVFGSAVVAAVLSSAIRTVVVPRGENVFLSRLVFGIARWCFRFFANEAHTYERRDRVMARYAPTALMMLPIVWAFGIMFGFTFMFWGIGVGGWRNAMLLSGSSLTTLGFRTADHTLPTLAAIVEALLGLGLVALLISFLPTIYSLFSRRETLVAKLFLRAEGRTGSSDPVTLLVRAHLIGGLAQLDTLFEEWDQWFVEVSESHRSFPSLTFFRSPEPNRSWVTGAGIALDLGAIYLAALDQPMNAHAALMVRTGFLALRDLCDFFGVPYDPDPSPDDPISVTRAEFDAQIDTLVAFGVPVRADRDAVWRDFAGWRVNYDDTVTRLADFTMAPLQAWISDRGAVFKPTLRRPKR